MTFAQWITRLGVDTTYHVEIGSRGYLQMVVLDNKIKLQAKADAKISPQAFDLLQYYTGLSWIDNLEFLMTVKILGNGPKIFRPTSEQMFALENMTLNLTYDDFKMPFETIVLELPEAYRKARALPTHEPHMSFIHKDPVEFMLHSLISGHESLKAWWAPFNKDSHMEDWFAPDFADVGTLKSTTEESELERLIRRAALNYCLLLDEVGIKKEGPASPNQYAQLVKWCQKNNKHTAKNKAQLAAQPILYALKTQKIELVRVEGNPAVPGDPTGRKVATHWRRGHYRMQRCGVGLVETKRVRIPAVMVNKDRLIGPTPTVIYES